MKVRQLGIASSLLVAVAVVACGGPERRSGFSEDDPTNTYEDGKLGGEDPGKAAECDINVVGGDPDKDYDGDGYALKDDCNECNPSVNKGAYDVPGNGIDDDCNGVVDDEEVACDDGIDIDTNDAFDGARAIGLCKKASKGGQDWGVVEAKWVKPDGSGLGDLKGVGVLPDFGVNAPQAGESLLALATGVARAPGQKGFKSGVGQNDDFGGSGWTSSPPDGYPKASSRCPGVGTGGTANDGAGLRVKIRVPSNAKSFSFQQFFFTYEFPAFICQRYNDFYVAMLDPIPTGLPDGNIAFDQDGNAISVNNSFLQVCEPGRHNDFDCPLGPDLLEGTGFHNDGGNGKSNGGTGWLTTTAPVEPGSEITLLFTLWNQGDHFRDSTVLIDDFKWSIEGADTAQTKPTGPK